MHEAKKIFCNQCVGDTNHVLRARYARPRFVHEGEQPGEIQTSIWSCAGCEEESFEWLFIGVADGPLEPTYFPPRSEDLPSSECLMPKPFRNLAPKLRRLYEETINSYNGGRLLVCQIGVGALLEEIYAEKRISTEKKDKPAEALGQFLPPNSSVVPAIIELVGARNDAAHRLQERGRDEVRKAIDFMEDLLNALYELDYKAMLVKPRLKKKAEFDAFKSDRLQ
jgi:hypothetical protein